MNKKWDSYLSQLAADPVEKQGFSFDRWSALAETGLFTIESSFDEGLNALIDRFRQLGATSPDRGLTFSAVTQIASSIYCIRAFGHHNLQSRFLPGLSNGTMIGGHAITESGAGSDVSNMDTTAVYDGSRYVLNGIKTFITNAPVADLLAVYAKTVRDGKFVGISSFVVPCDKNGIFRSEPMSTAGLRSSPIGTIEFRDVVVPEENRIGYEGGGMMILDQVMKREIVLAFAANVGEIEQRRNLAVTRANERVQFGQPIGSNQLVANKVVDMQIAIELGGALLEKVARDISGTKDVSTSTIAAKIFISEQNIDSALSLIQIFGAKGYLSDTGAKDILLDAVPGTIYSGANSTLRSKLASLLGLRSI